MSDCVYSINERSDDVGHYPSLSFGLFLHLSNKAVKLYSSIQISNTTHSFEQLDPDGCNSQLEASLDDIIDNHLIYNFPYFVAFNLVLDSLALLEFVSFSFVSSGHNPLFSNRFLGVQSVPENRVDSVGQRRQVSIVHGDRPVVHAE